MPSTRTVNINQIPTNEWGFVRGRVDWSRISSLIDGEELEQDIRRAQAFGRRFAIQRPYTRLSLYDATIVDYLGNPKVETDYTMMDRYLSESLFTRRNRSGWCFEGRNTSANLPEVGVYNITGGVVDIVKLKPGQELSQGSDVIVAIQCYAPRTKGFNKGLSMREVWAVGELELRTPGGPNGIDSYLSTLGITVNRDTEEVEMVGSAEVAPTSAPVAPAQAVAPRPVVPQQPQMPVVTQMPQAQPQPLTPPIPTAQPNPYNYAPQTPDPAMQPPMYGNMGVGLNAPVTDDEPF